MLFSKIIVWSFCLNQIPWGTQSKYAEQATASDLLNGDKSIKGWAWPLAQIIMKTKKTTDVSVNAFCLNDNFDPLYCVRCTLNFAGTAFEMFSL